MQSEMNFKEINLRYSNLSESDCCLSCGSAFNYCNAKLNEICVDLGSGRGTDVMRLSQLVGENGFAYGIDLSEGMIKKSENTANKLKIRNVKFVHSILEKIDLNDNIADVVISNCTINHSSDKQSVWNEIFRILKSEGRFVISDIYSVDIVPRKFSNDPVAIAECWAGAVTKPEYIKQIQNAGFNEFMIIEESKPYKKGEIEVVSFTIKGIKNN